VKPTDDHDLIKQSQFQTSAEAEASGHNFSNLTSEHVRGCAGYCIDMGGVLSSDQGVSQQYSQFTDSAYFASPWSFAMSRARHAV
jgi:hypothetical protein